MSALIIILFAIFALINAFCIFNIHSVRNFLRKLFDRKTEIKNRNLGILYELSSNNSILREYVIYNAPIFVYPFAAKTISSLNSLIQIISVLIFMFSIFKFNFAFLGLSVLFFFLSGITGSRFNNKRMIGNFTHSKKALQDFGADFHNLYYEDLSEFNERYYQELIKR